MIQQEFSKPSLVILSLPGLALRMLMASQGLRSDSTRVLKAEPGKLDIKRRKPGILLISSPIISLFKLAIMFSLSRFVSIQFHRQRHSKSATS